MKRDFIRDNINTVHYGEDSLKNLGYLIWEHVPSEIKECSTLSEFKNNIKKWVPDKCPCRLRKWYIQGLGYTTICNCNMCFNKLL